VPDPLCVVDASGERVGVVVEHLLEFSVVVAQVAGRGR